MTFFLQLTVASIAVFEHPSPLEKRDIEIRAPPDFDLGTHKRTRRLNEVITCTDQITALVANSFATAFDSSLMQTDTCYCEQLLSSHDGNGAITCSTTIGEGPLSSQCPQTCQATAIVHSNQQSTSCSSASSHKQCLENARACVWYLANYTGQGVGGRCHAYNGCKAWLWGQGSAGSGSVATTNVGYATCQGLSLGGGQSCATERVRIGLPPWFDPNEGPCYERLDRTVDISDERPVGTGIEYDNSLVKAGEHYCAVYTCSERLDKLNCTCFELIRNFEDKLHSRDACAEDMNEGDDDPCFGIVYDQCPLSCQTKASARQQLKKWRQELTQVGKLRTNIGKLLGLFYYPNMMLMANVVGWLVAAFAPFVKLNEYLWCQDCTY